MLILVEILTIDNYILSGVKFEKRNHCMLKRKYW